MPDSSDALDAQKTAMIIAAKQSFRDAQRNQTWEQKVAAIARMNAASKIAKAAMRAATSAPATDPE